MILLFRIEYENAVARRFAPLHGIQDTVGSGRDAPDPDVPDAPFGLLRDQCGDMGFADGTNGIPGDLRGLQGDSPEEMTPSLGHTPVLGIGRGDNGKLAAARIHDGVDLRAEVAAQRGVDFLVQGLKRVPIPEEKCRRPHFLIRFRRGECPALRVDNQHIVLQLRGSLGHAHQHNDSQALLGKLDPRVIGPRQIIGDDNDFLMGAAVMGHGVAGSAPRDGFFEKQGSPCRSWKYKRSGHPVKRIWAGGYSTRRK